MNDTGTQLFRSARAASGDWRTACRSCIAQLREPVAGANLGFVYASDPLTAALDLAVSELRRATGIADWVGTGGGGVCASGEEYVDEGALVVLVGRFPPDAYRLFDRLEDGRHLGADLAAWPAQGGAGFGVVHGDPRQDTTEAIPRLAQERKVFLVGGLSSSASGGAVQIAKRPSEGSLSGVLITPQVPVVTGISQGCSPIGPVHEVTGCRDAWITGLDGRPALEVLKEEMGELLARQLKRIGGYIHVALPVQGSDRADYLVRNLHGLNLQQQAIAVGTTLRRGDPLMFVRRDGAAAQADLRRMLGELRARTEGRPVRGALYHVCIARGPHLFGPDSAELRIIEDALGPVPLAGFFANGEIFNDRLYAYTGVLTLFL
jgi:small ligand-binding sensory domain FIST